MHKSRVIHNLLRRIEELEKKAAALRRDREYKVELALWTLEPDQLELLINSIDAENERRPLDTAESAARQAYTRALVAKCRSSPLSANRLVEKPSPVLEEFLRMLAAQTFSEEAFKLAASGERGQKEGRMTEAGLAIEELQCAEAASAPTRRLLSRDSGWEGGK